MALEAPFSPQGARSSNRDAVIDDLPLPEGQPASSGKPDDPPQTSQTHEHVGLSGMPVELAVDIFRRLDVPSALNLAITSKRFKSIFTTHLETIVVPILTRELSPVEGLLQVITASPDDLNDQRALCLRRKILHGSRVVCQGEQAYDESTTTVIEPVTVTLHLGHLKRLLDLTRVTKGWEKIFADYRLVNPDHRRALLPHELERFRAGLYHWMSYAYYFHGNLPRPNPWVPWKWSADPRCNWMRLLSDLQLHEFEDVWVTVRYAVACLVCPSLELNMKNMGEDKTKEEVEKASFGSAAGVLPPGLTSWSDDAQWLNYHSWIVDTFMKLPPDVLFHFIDNRHKYSKDELIREVLDLFPNFQQDRESLTYVLAAVQDERREKRQAAGLAQGWSGHDPTPQFWEGRLLRWDRSGGVLDWFGVDDRAIRAHWAQGSDRTLRLAPEDGLPAPRLVHMQGGLMDTPPGEHGPRAPR